MTRIVLDVTVSLDGFMTGPNVRAEEPMGDGGERLHDWMAGEGPDGEVDRQVAAATNARAGAVIVGRHTFELGLRNWGGTPLAGIPTFVVTHRPQEDFVGDNGGTFAFDGLEAAAQRAREAAGDKDVLVLGAEVSRGLLRAGLLDEVHLHIAPLLMGAGTRLFDGEQGELIPEGKLLAGAAAHLRYRVSKG